MWLTVTHTFKRSEPRLAEWSKWICTTLRSCFCRVLTSNWKVSTGRFSQSFITFIQTTQNFVIILYIEDIETNLPIGKHTLRVLYEILKRLFQKFVLTFNLCVCFYLLHFVSLFNNLCCGSLVTHTFKGNGPNSANWSKLIFANNLFKISCNYTLGMFSNWKICFNVFHARCKDDFLCNLSKINKTV